VTRVLLTREVSGVCRDSRQAAGAGLWTRGRKRPRTSLPIPCSGWGVDYIDNLPTRSPRSRKWPIEDTVGAIAEHDQRGDTCAISGLSEHRRGNPAGARPQCTPSAICRSSISVDFPAVSKIASCRRRGNSASALRRTAVVSRGLIKWATGARTKRSPRVTFRAAASPRAFPGPPTSTPTWALVEALRDIAAAKDISVAQVPRSPWVAQQGDGHHSAHRRAAPAIALAEALGSLGRGAHGQKDMAGHSNSPSRRGAGRQVRV